MLSLQCIRGGRTLLYQAISRTASFGWPRPITAENIELHEMCRTVARYTYAHTGTLSPSDFGELRSCRSVAATSPRSCRKLLREPRSGPTRRNLADLDHLFAGFGHVWPTRDAPKLVNVRPALANFGQRISQFGQNSPKFGRISAPGATVRQLWDNLGATSELPGIARVGANYLSATFGLNSSGSCSPASSQALAWESKRGGVEDIRFLFVPRLCDGRALGRMSVSLLGWMRGRAVGVGGRSLRACRTGCRVLLRLWRALSLRPNRLLSEPIVNTKFRCGSLLVSAPMGDS